MDSIKEKIEEFFSKYKIQKYKKGEILVRAGDDPAGIFYLKSGLVREYAISKTGEEVVVNIFKTGAFFPMSFAINKTPNTYFFEAMEDLILVRAPSEDVVEFIKTNSDVLFDLLRRVYLGTDGLLSRMAYLMSGSASERLIIELIITAKRFGTKESSEIMVSTTEKDLATQTGITRETVSREIKKLKDKGLIDFGKHSLVIKDIAKLEEEIY
ncbi:MAG TPA: Crp/Fnr family transcriptional regulator [Patescibacteria group bacterium]|nr:Crp/Fnr family transcriptional regulator [Patescibacteria group bacterium]